MTDLNMEFIKSFYKDDLEKKIIEVLSEVNLSNEEKIEKLVKFMGGDIE
ncbi:hypothetical protein [Methanomethylophilus alvi]